MKIKWEKGSSETASFQCYNIIIIQTTGGIFYNFLYMNFNELR